MSSKKPKDNPHPTRRASRDPLDLWNDDYGRFSSAPSGTTNVAPSSPTSRSASAYPADPPADVTETPRISGDFMTGYNDSYMYGADADAADGADADAAAGGDDPPVRYSSSLMASMAGMDAGPPDADASFVTGMSMAGLDMRSADDSAAAAGMDASFRAGMHAPPVGATARARKFLWDCNNSMSDIPSRNFEEAARDAPAGKLSAKFNASDESVGSQGGVASMVSNLLGAKSRSPADHLKKNRRRSSHDSIDLDELDGSNPNINLHDPYGPPPPPPAVSKASVFKSLLQGGGGGAGTGAASTSGSASASNLWDSTPKMQLKNSGITIEYFDAQTSTDSWAVRGKRSARSGGQQDIDSPGGGRRFRVITTALEPISEYLPNNKRRAMYWLVACAALVAIIEAAPLIKVLGPRGGAPSADGAASAASDGDAGAGVAVDTSDSSTPKGTASSATVTQHHQPSDASSLDASDNAIEAAAAAGHVQYDRYNQIRRRIIDAGISTEEDLDATPDNVWHGSPQHQALKWLADRDARLMDPNDKATLPHLLERYALAVFYYATYEVKPWLLKDDWMTGQGVCSWYGIFCAEGADRIAKTVDGEVSYDGTVVRLALSDNDLSGTIPAELWKVMTHIQVLDLSHNSLSGPIGADIGAWDNLQVLHLGENDLVGPIPDGLCLLRDRSLENFVSDCDKTQCDCCTECLTSAVSGQMESVQEAEASLPQPSDSTAASVTEENASNGPGDNDRFSQIRQHIIDAGVSTVEDLDATPDNVWHGSPQHQALKWLADRDGLMMDPNDEATLPHFLERYALAVFYYSTYEVLNWLTKDDWMTGQGVCSWHGVFCAQSAAPMAKSAREASNDGNVVRLTLASNKLGGTIPDEFWKVMTNLQFLDLSHNSLSGSIGADVGTWTNLEVLDLGGNSFGHQLPNEIGNLKKLTKLELNTNQFTGTIPSSLSNCKMLDVIYLDANGLTGEIPKELAQLDQLTDLRLRSNHLKGTIAPEFGNLKELKIMYLDDNNLSGLIPSTLGNLHRLEELHLYKNKLSGNLATELGSLRYLSLMYLDSNEIEGSIPESFGDLHSLEQLFLFGNKLTGSIPDTLYGIANIEDLRLNDNSLSGTLAPEIGKLLLLKTFHAENNNFQGSLPDEISKMNELEVLRVQNNGFEGTVSDGICLLTDHSLGELVADCTKIECQCCTECI